MSDQWEKYVEAAGDAMLDCDHNGIQCYSPKSIDETARAVLAAVGPLIVDDTRVRLVAAAARAVEREPLAGCTSTHPDASHIPCVKPSGHVGDHVSRRGRNWRTGVQS